jgi:solute carrier family 25 S-adenosylmethionine transporter 26
MLLFFTTTVIKSTNAAAASTAMHWRRKQHDLRQQHSSFSSISSQFMNSNNTKDDDSPSLLWLDLLKTGLAGGVGGAVASGLLYPFDAAKTLRQARPDRYETVWTALRQLMQQRTVYAGVWTAITGAVPSSALYFGAYESAKRVLQTNHHYFSSSNSSLAERWLLHASAAATGNVVSSAIFVPKELIKQQLQYHGGNSNVQSVVRQILQQRGMAGLYTGYAATLLRNIPSAALRFGFYEEFKRAWCTNDDDDDDDHRAFRWKLFAAGAAAGALASGFMTPVDVLKTRLSTGTCAVDLQHCVRTVIQESGYTALWAGAGSRMINSAAFSAIGFGTFEAAKHVFGVHGDRKIAPSTKSPVLPSSSSTRQVKTAIAAAAYQQPFSTTTTSDNFDSPMPSPQYYYLTHQQQPSFQQMGVSKPTANHRFFDSS